MSRPCRSTDEWMQLISACRRSGLSDARWCEQNDISVHSFYNAVVRLRKQSYDIPRSTAAVPVRDLTSRKQDVVCVGTMPDLPAEGAPETDASVRYFDNPYTIEISAGSVGIRLTNAADPLLAAKLLSVLGGVM